MSLEFNKLLQQVEKMGAMVSHLDFDMTDRLALARERFAAADDLDEIRRKIDYVRGPEISGYRGAARPTTRARTTVSSRTPATVSPTTGTSMPARFRFRCRTAS